MILLKSKLLDYQEKAFNKLKNLPFGCLFLDPGLGKTITSIALAQYWIENKECDTVCVFTKKHLIKTWQEEFEIHTNLKPLIPNIKNNFLKYSFFPSGSVHILHYNSTQTILNHILFLFRNFKVGLILDECQVIKNFESAMTKRFLLFNSLASKKLVLTGTPVANRPFDILSQVSFLNPSKSIRASFPNKVELDIPRNGLHKNFKSLEESIRLLRRQIGAFSFFYTKENVKLNSKRNIEYIYFDLSRPHKIYYKKELEVIRCSHTKRMILRDLGVLIKACSSPFKRNEKQAFLTSKDVYLLKELKEQDKRKVSCVVWCSFIETSKRLARLLKFFRPILVNGSMNIAERTLNIDKFKKGDSKVLIATMQSCKEGLNLQNASYAYFYDLSLKLEDILQAQDRIHRLSQTKDVFIKFLIYKNTVESWIVDLFKLKKHLSVDIFNNYLNLNTDVIFGTSDELKKYLLNERKK